MYLLFYSFLFTYLSLYSRSCFLGFTCIDAAGRRGDAFNDRSLLLPSWGRCERGSRIRARSRSGRGSSPPPGPAPALRPPPSAGGSSGPGGTSPHPGAGTSGNRKQSGSGRVSASYSGNQEVQQIKRR